MATSPLKFSLLFSFLFCLTASGFGQNQIDEIVDRDPFDPSRGKKEEVVVEEEEKEVVEVQPENVAFVLDGTVIFPNNRMAIIQYTPEPEPAVDRGRMLPPTRGKNAARRSPVRRPGNRARSNKKTESSRLSLNEELQGYKLTQVESDYVVLTKGREQLTLRMFNGSKEDRGGSKMVAKVAPKKVISPANEARALSKNKNKNAAKPTPVRKVEPKKNNARRPNNNNNERRNNKAQPVRRSVPKREF